MRKGFTLIELLVVISIVGLLSSVVLSSINSARAKARDAKRYSDIRQINNAIQLYILANGKAPDLQGTCGPTEADVSCSAASGVGGNDNWIRLQTDLAPYLSRLPTDPCGEPCNGNQYQQWAIYQYFAPAQMTDACGSSITCTSSTRYHIYAQYLETKGGPYGFRVGYSSN